MQLQTVSTWIAIEHNLPFRPIGFNLENNSATKLLNQYQKRSLANLKIIVLTILIKIWQPSRTSCSRQLGRRKILIFWGHLKVRLFLVEYIFVFLQLELAHQAEIYALDIVSILLQISKVINGRAILSNLSAVYAIASIFEASRKKVNSLC